MELQQIHFSNRKGEELVGSLEMPIDRQPHNYALFAHCFTCNKEFAAIKNISKALVSNGFGVLRLDFTGLGESGGEFSNTNFPGNVEDLIDAANFMGDTGKPPVLLVGHSLGGAAALFAAAKIESVHAVATIGAPSEPGQIKRLVESDTGRIAQTGAAQVNLGGSSFTIKQQFLDDLEGNKLQATVKKMRKPLLLLHSPQDRIFGIEHAERLYKAAHHPKSFISLDGADHLLCDKSDSLYAGNVISSWVQRYISLPEIPDLSTSYQVVAGLGREDGFSTQLKVGSHYLKADEPVSVGGNDYGPSPYELVSAGLAACTAMTLQMYAKRKNWPLDEVIVHTSYEGKIHADDCRNCESEAAKIATFERAIELAGPLGPEQQARLLEIANKCPVHRTLDGPIQVKSHLLHPNE